MEIVGEILVFLLQVLAELALQAVIEALAELGFHGLRARLGARPPPHPVIAALGHLVLGTAGGGLSLLVFPDSFIGHPILRIANLVVTPVCLGVIMGVIGAWRRRHGQELIRLDQFAYAYLFALGLAGVRFIWA